MKFIRQVSTNDIVMRENPHTSKTLNNASVLMGIDVSDLIVEDRPSWSEEDYSDGGITLTQAKKLKKQQIKLQLRRLLREHVHPHQMDKLVDNITVPASVITYKSDLGTVRTTADNAIDAAIDKLEVYQYAPVLPTPPNA